MDNVIEESGRIASLALFRELFDSEKDIYGVISCFLKEIIVTEAKFSFTSREITCLLNETFSFQIPEAVVRTSLRRINNLKSENGQFFPNVQEITKSSLISRKNKIVENNDLIIDKIIKFIAQAKVENISDIEKEEIMHSFCSFLLDRSNKQKYSEYISTFIIQNEQDGDFIKQLRLIKEGVILYAGIWFTDNLNNRGSWDTELTIFLDTEILFDFAGYNGELNKILFNDFHSLVREINQKAKKTLIKLTYFPKIERIIEHFFYTAEQIFNGDGIIDPGKPAMNYILNGCKNKSEIYEKKASFFHLLEKNDIIPDEGYDYYHAENYKYNIEDQKIDEIVKDNVTEDKNIPDILESLNYINIRRGKASDKDFEHVKYILLTGNKVTIAIANLDEVKPGRVHLATFLGNITNRLWFKLGKGFGIDAFPRVFDVITKAQLILSSQLNDSISTQFEKDLEKYKSGGMDKEEIALRVAELKKQALRSKEIDEENVAYVLESIKQSDLDCVIEEHVLFKEKAKKNEEENVRLMSELEKSDALIKNHEEERRGSERNRLEETSALRGELLLEKRKNLETIEYIKRAKDKIINRNLFVIYILLPIVLAFAYYILLAAMTFVYGWNNIEPLTYFLGALPILAGIIILLIQGRKIKIIDWIKAQKEKYRLKKYKEYDIDLYSYEKLKNEIENIDEEIAKIKVI